MSEDFSRDFLLGFVRIHILYHAAKGPIYGKFLKDELKEHGYDLSYGTLYPILHKLERTGYLKVSKQSREGHFRKYYIITKKGKQGLREGKEKVTELLRELEED